MMNFTYNNISYSKRPLTSNLLLHVIASDPAQIQTPAYEKDAWITKGAELASQADACPMVGRDLIIPVYNCIRREPGVRARHVETGSAIAVQGTFEPYTQEDASCQIACGSLANLAKAYSKDTLACMLSHGILPLLTDMEILPGSLIYVKGIRDVLLAGTHHLEAYRYDRELDEFTPIAIRLAEYSQEQLEKILG